MRPRRRLLVPAAALATTDALLWATGRAAVDAGAKAVL